MGVIHQALLAVGTAPGGGGDFDEANLLWRVRAEDLALSDGDPVAIWADLSGNARDWVQATSGNRPTYQAAEVNGKAAVQFVTASSQYLNGPNLSGLGLTETDTFVVLRAANDPPSNVSKVGLWLLGDISSNFFSLCEYPATDGLIKEAAFQPGTLNERVEFNFTESLASWRLYRVTAKTGFEGLSTGNYRIYIDGSVGNVRTMSGLSFGAVTHLGRSVWSSGSGTSHWDGMVAEFFCFSARASSGQYDTIRGYVNDYYGLSVV